MIGENVRSYKIVLTTDRTLMSDYNGLIFLGFSACVPRGLIPDRLYFSLFCPSAKANKDGSAKYAPCGSRKIEATLLDKGLKREDVVVAHPDHLDKVVGPNTKVLAITETDPLGIGPATSTFTQVLGGEAYMAIKFRELLNNPAVRMYKPKIILGGPGAWQLEDPEARKRLGVDCVVIGEGEKVAYDIIKKAFKGEQLPEVVHGETVNEDEIPCIKEPTVDGVVEIARGCGRGCAFCVPTLQRYRCLPMDHILKEVEVNLKAGLRPLLHAEDVLRYKAKGLEINREAVIDLFKTVKSYPGVDSVAFSHFALSSVVSAPDLVKEISSILDAGKDGSWLSGQTGIETGSPRLIKEHMMGKCKPFSPEDWPQIVLNAFEILSKASWVPCASLIIGLPGETERDVDLTINLVEKLRAFKSLIVPLFLVSEGTLKGKAESFSAEDMTPKRSELFLKCWEHNLDWAKVFLKEYLSTRNKWEGYGLRLVVSYGIKQGKELIRKCQEDYEYDLPAMIRDAQAGKISVAPMPLRVIYKFIKSS
ncbi:MAG TPA: radical SAM protein [Candidatus Bathyarchaeia archaeon]|nr:radical SAM protein [Candidatus Bathyarchaeia archaeon]